MDQSKKRFSRETRTRLIQRFREKYSKAHPGLIAPIRLQAEFIRTLTLFGITIPVFQKFEHTRKQPGREQLQKLARQLASLSQCLREIEISTLGCATLHALEELQSKGFDFSEILEPYATPMERYLAEYEPSRLPKVTQVDIRKATRLTYHVRKDVLPIIDALALGAQRASKNLPVSNYSSKYDAAFSLRQLFADCAIPFTIGETGFAAECFRAIFSLAGLEMDRVSYWLKMAPNHPFAGGLMYARD